MVARYSAMALFQQAAQMGTVLAKLSGSLQHPCEHSPCKLAHSTYNSSKPRPVHTVYTKKLTFGLSAWHPPGSPRRA